MPLATPINGSVAWVSASINAMINANCPISGSINILACDWSASVLACTFAGEQPGTVALQSDLFQEALINSRPFGAQESSLALLPGEATGTVALQSNYLDNVFAASFAEFFTLLMSFAWSRARAA